jgi:hypothetical protein
VLFVIDDGGRAGRSPSASRGHYCGDDTVLRERVREGKREDDTVVWSFDPTEPIGSPNLLDWFD